MGGAEGRAPTIRVRGLEFGAPAPAVIVPLTGASADAVVAGAAGAAAAGADLVEWRVDLVTDQRPDAVASLLPRLRAVLGEIPLLGTVRTPAEGGSAAGGPAEYVALIEALCGGADLVDVEHRHPEAAAALDLARAAGVGVVASAHDFAATPPVDEIVTRLAAMEAAGASVAKIAVTPRSHADVAVLLEATAVRFAAARIPLITMSMGRLGAVSRVVGHLFGSAATFATVWAASAPGQAALGDVRAVLAALDRVTTAAGGVPGARK